MADDTTPELVEEKPKEAEVEAVDNKKEDVAVKESETVAEDSGDDSTVLVDHKDVEEQPRALQVFSIGTEENSYAFTFHKERLEAIMKRIPSDTKVAVVSVVGAFRTGKSFLLSFFLRYLHHLKLHGKTAVEVDPGEKRWYEEVASIGNDGFEWRAGSERNTTGIWLWSHPHILEDQNMAVLLVDTQGMFDNETTMSLTACIFGLSTLLSSYEIYNVDKMIGEDALQQLALFTEYARAAMATGQEKEGDKPFQLVEFLVRDWQHFEEEEDCEIMAKEMETVLEKIMADREASDLQETREQITMCFDKIQCYGLVHPGFAVTKKSYAGEIDKIEPMFLALLDRYLRRIFDNLVPKKIHGRELTGEELAVHIEQYAELFASGAKFPTAATMLEATAQANNTNATTQAIRDYKETMNRIAGPDCSNYMKDEELQEQHNLTKMESLRKFDSIANFGSKRSIDESKRKLVEQMEEDFVVYTKLNQSRDPMFGMGPYLFAFGALGTLWFAIKILDGLCGPKATMCMRTSELLRHLHAVAFFFLLLVAGMKWTQVVELFRRLQAMFFAANGQAPPPSRPGGAKAKKD